MRYLQLLFSFSMILLSGCQSTQWYKPGTTSHQIMIDSQVAWLAAAHHARITESYTFLTSYGSITRTGWGGDPAYFAAQLQNIGYHKISRETIPNESKAPTVISGTLNQEIGLEAARRYASRGKEEQAFIQGLIRTDCIFYLPTTPFLGTEK